MQTTTEPADTLTVKHFISDIGNDVFIKKAEEYIRDIDVVPMYCEQAGKFLSIIENIPYEEAFEEVRENIRPGGDYPMKNPKIRFIEKDENQDRYLNESGTMMGYMRNTILNRDIMAATFTRYCHPDIIQSYHVDFIDGALPKRKVFKNKQFRAKAEMNTRPEAKLEFIFANNRQNNIKKAVNSISGGTSIPSTPLYMPTIHSTLTSNCRMTSGYGNANNEKLLSGNRHYHNANVTLNNLVSLTTRIDEKAILGVIERHKLYVPTAEELHEYIMRSSNQYWRWKEYEDIIFEFISKCNTAQKASIAFNYDMFAMAKFNDTFFREFITRLSADVEVNPSLTIPVAKDIVYGTSEDVRNVAIQINADRIKGLDLMKYAETDKILRIASSVINIHKTLAHYSDYIEVFCKTQHMPLSLGFFPTSLRHCVVMSDTDSTIFTVQDWVKWYFGEYIVNQDANRVFAVMVFLSVATLRHILAQMSANLGVETKRIWQIAMKNEFKFERFVAMLHTKHYKASITYQEGQVLKNYDTETKGVHLRNSNSPAYINDACDEMMKRAYNFDGTQEKINVLDFLKEAADLERMVIKSVEEGDVEFYRGGKVKDADTYADGEDSHVYKQYLFWNATFGKKYGEAPPPPYGVVKIKLAIKNKTEFKKWVDSIEDKQLAEAIAREGRMRTSGYIASIALPYENFIGKSIPKEIIPFVARRELISDICSPFYYMFETFGLVFLDKNVTKLISDQY